MAETKLEGFKEIESTLKLLGPRIEKNALRAGLRAGGRLMVNAARDRVPVSPEGSSGNRAYPSRNHPSGNLKRSLGVVSPKGKPGTVLVQVTARMGTKAKAGGSGGSKAADGWYAHFVEFGTVDFDSQPFMRPAFETTKGLTVKQVADKINDYLAKVIQKKKF